MAGWGRSELREVSGERGRGEEEEKARSLGGPRDDNGGRAILGGVGFGDDHSFRF